MHTFVRIQYSHEKLESKKKKKKITFCMLVCVGQTKRTRDVQMSKQAEV